ncbi:MAG: shikimate kinase [Burkholderiaceae bacterium]|nr:shikimate kinase [Burkholderiaceae bacterium]
MPTVTLIGYRGTGKTTVAAGLARRLGCPWWDADVELERRVGTTIASLIRDHGEPHFRDEESGVLGELLATPEGVLATGGGAILLPDNRRVLAERGTVIYLHANPIELWHRTKGGEGRPLLQHGDSKMILENLYAIRDPLYREIADFIIETGKPSVNQLVSSLLMQLELAP